MRGLRRIVGGGELGEGDAVVDGLGDMLLGRVVVARQHDAAPARHLRDRLAVAGGRLSCARRRRIMAWSSSSLIPDLPM
jgi:hypothetical protein